MTTLAPLARCTTRGCAWRWPTPPDRPCAQHQADLDDGTYTARMQALTEVMSAPGEGAPAADGQPVTEASSQDGQQRMTARP